MSATRPLSKGLLAAVAGMCAVVIAVVAVGVVLLVRHSSPSKSADKPPEKVKSVGASRPLPKATLQIVSLHHHTLPFAQPLRVNVTNGALSSVNVVQADGGAPLVGTFNKTRTKWHSKTALAPASSLHATIEYADLAHHVAKKSVKIKTPTVTSHFTDEISPADGLTVGVAEPVSVTFDVPIPDNRRAAVEKAMTVSASPSVVGAWHWMSDQTVDWRPPAYWTTGTKVKVTSNLVNVSLGHGVWGDPTTHTAKFKIGASHISEVDQATETMKIYDNGKLIKTFPDSTGRGQYPTMDGVHIVLSKQSVIEMNSATVGIPKGNPDYYDETVYWDSRISNGGEFVHAAPWSVGDQGHENVSHGCVNLSTENAEWFYNWAQVGDVVDIYNGVRPPESGDAGTADWNMTWKQWLKGDADPSPAALALHPLTPRQGEPNFIPVKKHKKHHHKKHHKASPSSAATYGATDSPSPDATPTAN